MKKILIVCLIVLSIFLIYLGLQDKKVYYLSLGDEFGMGLLDDGNKYGYSDYINEYLIEKNKLEVYINGSKEDNRTTDMIKFIKNNDLVADKKIKNALIKVDLLTLSIGYDDLIIKFNKYNTNKINSLIDSYLEDLEELYALLRQYCKEDIVMIGYYNVYQLDKFDNKISYLNNKTKELCEKYDIYFIDIEDLENYSGELYPTKEGYHIIFNRIRKIIDEHVLD